MSSWRGAWQRTGKNQPLPNVAISTAAFFFRNPTVSDEYTGGKVKLEILQGTCRILQSISETRMVMEAAL
jgi:hypothetical protein